MMQIKEKIINYKYLSNLDINDSFFDSLKKDYANFNKWFKEKQENNIKAYVTEENGKLTSFLLLKIEDENEEYNNFLKPFKPGKRLKISTFKIDSKANTIIPLFMDIIYKTAIKENVKEIYVTIFDKHKKLMQLLKCYGFIMYTKKRTLKPNGKYGLENVLVRYIRKEKNE